MHQQLITFQLGGQVLGVDITAIREIRAWSPATPLPGTPVHVRGVVNLRGVVLPVLDLRQLLGWGETDASGRHVIIVLHIQSQLRGLIVDAVDDIVSIDLAELQPPPDVGEPALKRRMRGIATINERMVMVLALECLERNVDTLPQAA